MKKIILSLIVLFCTILISCSALLKKNNSPEEDLIDALNEGKSYIGEGHTFTGPIDFNEIFNKENTQSIYIHSELRFTRCTFKGPILWHKQANRKLYFRKDIVFEDCIFEDEVIINDAVFEGIIQIGKGLFHHSLDLQRNSYKSMCRLDENEIGHDMVIQYSRCHEDFSFFGNSVGNNFLGQGISVYGKSQMSNLQINGSIDLSNAQFHEDFMMDYAKGGKKLLGGNSTFHSRFFVRNISGFEQIDLSGNIFMGKYMFSDVNNQLSPDLQNSTKFLEIP